MRLGTGWRRWGLSEGEFEAGDPGGFDALVFPYDLASAQPQHGGRLETGRRCQSPRGEGLRSVGEAAFITAADVIGWHVVATSCRAKQHAIDLHFGSGEGDVKDIDPAFSLLCVFK